MIYNYGHKLFYEKLDKKTTTLFQAKRYARWQTDAPAHSSYALTSHTWQSATWHKTQLFLKNHPPQQSTCNNHYYWAYLSKLILMPKLTILSFTTNECCIMHEWHTKYDTSKWKQTKQVWTNTIRLSVANNLWSLEVVHATATKNFILKTKK